MENKNDFSIGSIRRNIFSLSLPLIIAQFANALYNIVDRIYISHIPENGDMALTGVGITFPLIMIVSAFTALCGQGGAPFCSIERGKGDYKKAGQIMGNSFVLLLLSGILCTTIGLIIKKPILYAFGASNATFPFANDYITIYLSGSIFVMIGLGMTYFVNSQGFGKISMIGVFISSLSNIILDPIFIFSLDMGVKGAALATIISQFLTALWVMFFLCGKKAILKLSFNYFKPDLKLISKILMMGLSSFCMKLTASAVQIASNAVLSSQGGDIAVEAMTIINSVREMVMMPFNGFTEGSQPVTGYNYGAKKYGRVRECIAFVTKTCAIYSVFICAFILLFPGFLVKIFDNSQIIYRIGTRGLRIYFCMFFIMCLQMAGQSTFVALGKSKQAVFFTLLRKAFIVVPLTFLLPHLFDLGTDGVFLAEPISNVIGSLACYLTLYFSVIRKLPKE